MKSPIFLEFSQMAGYASSQCPAESAAPTDNMTVEGTEEYTVRLYPVGSGCH